MITIIRIMSVVSICAAIVAVAVFVRGLTLEAPPEFSGAFEIVEKTVENGDAKISAHRGDITDTRTYPKWFYNKAVVGDTLYMTLHRATILCHGKHVATYFYSWIEASILCGGALISLLSCLAWLPRSYLRKHPFSVWIAGLSECFSVGLLWFCHMASVTLTITL